MSNIVCAHKKSIVTTYTTKTNITNKYFIKIKNL